MVYDRTDGNDIFQRIGDAEIVFTNKTPLNREVFSTLPKLKYVGVLATGYNVVDVAAAQGLNQHEFKLRFEFVQNKRSLCMSEIKQKYFEEGRELSVLCSADVVVAGGGSAGFAAALAAARNNAKTIIIEREYAMGGIMTTGLMAKVAIEPYMEGIPTEVMMRLGKDKMAIPPCAFPPKCPVTEMTEVPVDPEASKKVLDDMLIEANVHILYGCIVAGVMKEGDTVKGVIVESKNGRQVIEGKVFIDATGDGDLSVQAGAGYQIGREEDGLCSAPTLMFRIGNVDMEALIQHFEKHPDDLKRNKSAMSPQQIRECVLGDPPQYAHIGGFNETIRRVAAKKGFSEWEWSVLSSRNGILVMNLPNTNQVLVNTSRILGKNAIDAQDISDSMLEGRRQCWFIHEFLKNNIPGFENAFLMDTASILGIRETRRIIGDYFHTTEDFRNRMKFDDAILKNTDSIEFHNPKGEGTAFERYQEGEYEEISYRSILVKGLSNVMVIGRCFSADQLALSCNRSIGFCFSMGQAAGTAAAMALNGGKDIRAISVIELQKKVYPQKFQA